jgi:hypothetical protein
MEQLETELLFPSTLSLGVLYTFLKYKLSLPSSSCGHSSHLIYVDSYLGIYE